VDENLNPETEQKPVCATCGNPEILEGYPIKLCNDCRNKFIQFPIPVWVKLFGAGIAVILLVSAIWLPQNLGAAIALSRAENAEKNRDYLTEQRELEKAKKSVPNSIDILGHLAVASFYNFNLGTTDSTINALQKRNFEDTALLHNINYIIDELKSFYPSEAFDTAFTKYKKTLVPDTALERYIRKNPNDMYALYTLASSSADKDEYQKSDTLLSRILTIQPDFILALNMKCMTKRELNQFDSSAYYCDRLLYINHQSTYAMSAKARTLVKSGKNKEGLELALKVSDLNKNDPYNLTTLAIAYHFNKNYKERDRLIDLAEKDSVSRYYMKYAKEIFSGKIKYQ